MNQPGYPPHGEQLQRHWQQIREVHLKDLFRKDPLRGETFSISHKGVYIDFSKQHVTAETVNLLCRLAEESGVTAETERMFSGERINKTEDRAVLHTALRYRGEGKIEVNGHDVMPAVKDELQKMKTLSGAIRSGKWEGYSGKPVKNIVNIGIGGSDLGPRMAVEALKIYGDRHLSVHFVSNVDPSQLLAVLEAAGVDQTLFVVSSKSFTTIETMTNACLVKERLISHFGSDQCLKDHLVAVTACPEKAEAFGIDGSRILGFRDWVGGRFSVSSAIGFPLMTVVGYDHFMSMLDGFYDMDTHFRTAPFKENIPVMMALLGIWNRNFFNYSSHTVAPYDHHLRLFPVFLQQLEMESNGKSVNRKGDRICYPTAPVIWGEAGTNGQHSFFQLLHQGIQAVPVDFIGCRTPLHDETESHRILLSGMLAQSRALAFGKTPEELKSEGVDPELIPYRTCEGNRPSTTILIDKLTPYTLGQLIAIYEHKTFVQGILWNIFSFDQWGVELGKSISNRIIRAWTDGDENAFDSSTNNLLKKLKK